MIDASRAVSKCHRNGAAPRIVDAGRLSTAQQRLWVLEQQCDLAGADIISGGLNLYGPLNVQVLERTIQEIVACQESLRTVFRTDGGAVEQVVLGVEPFQLSSVDCPTKPELNARQTEFLAPTWDLEVGPLYRFALLRTGRDRHRLLWAFHHIISDIGSVTVFVGELVRIYEARCEGKGHDVSRPPISYLDFARREAHELQSGREESDVAFWRRTLRGAPPALEIPTDRPRPRYQTFEGTTLVHALPKELIDALKGVGREAGATFFMVALAVFKVLLLRYSGETDIVVGTPVAGRSRSDTSGLMGLLFNSVPLRTDLSADPSFSELLRRVREVALASYSHMDLPFDRIVEEAGGESDLGRPEVFQVMFGLQNTPRTIEAPPGLEITPATMHSGGAMFDLGAFLFDREVGAELHVEYNTDLFDEETIWRAAWDFEGLAAAAVADPEKPISELRMLSREEAEALYGESESSAVPSADATGDALQRRSDVADWYYVPTWSQIPAASLSPEADSSGQRWLVLATDDEMATELTRRLEFGEREVIRVVTDAQYRRTPGGFALDPFVPDHFESLVADLAREGRLPTHVLHLWTLGTEPVHLEDGKFEDALARGFHTLVDLARALQGAVESPVQLQVVTDGLVGVLGRGAIDPMKSTMIGPCKVIPREFHRIRCRMIDVERPSTVAELDNLCAELIADLERSDHDGLLAYRGDRRFASDYRPVKLTGSSDRACGLRDRGVCLITGGLGGIGLTIAGHLAEAAKARLALVSRTPLPDRSDWEDWVESHPSEDATSQKLLAIREVEARGGEVMVVAADVTDASSLAAAIDRVRSAFGRIDGVVHAAGVPGGALLQSSDRNRLARTLAPKVLGTAHLLNLLDDDPPDFVVLCSSKSAVLADAAQADYCSANAFLDACAHHSAVSSAGRVVSVNWDTWSEVGMAVRDDMPEAVRLQMEEQIRLGITPAEGAVAFDRVVGAQAAQIVVSTRDFRALHTESRQVVPAPRSPQIASVSVEGATIGPLGGLDIADGSPLVASKTFQVLTDIWVDLLGVAEVEEDDNFFDLGGSSLLALQLSATVEERLGVSFPSSVFLGNTLGQMATQCDELLELKT